MTTATIRAAGPPDAPALAELRFDLRTIASRATEPRDTFVDRCARWMADQLAAGRWRAWVAEADAGVVGQIWLEIIEKIPNPVGERGRLGYISNLYVAPVARGGTGTALLEAALAYASRERVDRVVLWPTPASRTLYRRFGFRPDGDVVELAL